MNTTHAQLSKTHSNGLSGVIDHYVPPLGRFALSFIFLMSAVGKATSFSGTAAFMESKGMPVAPFFLVMAILFELIGGLAVLTGYKARLGAVALIVFLIPATLIFHNFWAYTGQEQMMQMTNFLKNVAIGGGLLLVASRGAGPLSLDERKQPVTRE